MACANKSQSSSPSRSRKSGPVRPGQSAGYPDWFLVHPWPANVPQSVAHRLLSKKIILALSVCLCASDRHGATSCIPPFPNSSSFLFFLIFILQNGRQTCLVSASISFFVLCFAYPGVVVCSSVSSYEAHPIKQLWKWSKK